jgi:hypothetical protein
VLTFLNTKLKREEMAALNFNVGEIGSVRGCEAVK